MADSADELIQAFQTLPAQEQAKASVALSPGRPLPAPPSKVVAALWLIVVSAFAIVFVGGTYLLYDLTTDDKSTDVIFPIVSGVLGVLAGLLAPSPVGNK